ncbi:MAG: pyridoxal-phosphate dependent enzyme [Eubacteriaceae bacterium]|jgi:cysteine synthase A|nr:pyridoxal-phosphate dependent enzyme [Eubacteriaceae bacterium]
MKVANSALELVGETPLMRLNALAKRHLASSDILAKLEFFNPLSHDRVANAIAKELEGAGIPKKSALFSWSFDDSCLSLALYASSKGMPFTVVMPDTSKTKNQGIVRAMGGEIELSSAVGGPEESESQARRLAQANHGTYIDIGQMKLNAQYYSAAPEIWRDSSGMLDAFIAPIAFGSDLSGFYHYFKEKRAEIRVFGAASESGVGEDDAYVLENHVKSYDELLVSGVDEVLDEIDAAAQLEGLIIGDESAAALCASYKVAKRPEYRGKRIVCLLTDGGIGLVSNGY